MENVYFWTKQRICNEAMKVNALKLNPKNPRVIKDEKFKQLVKSIKEFPEMMAKRPMVCVGRKIARQNAVNKIWLLEGYLLKQRLSEQ